MSLPCGSFCAFHCPILMFVRLGACYFLKSKYLDFKYLGPAWRVYLASLSVYVHLFYLYVHLYMARHGAQVECGVGNAKHFCAASRLVWMSAGCGFTGFAIIGIQHQWWAGFLGKMVADARCSCWGELSYH